jgi:hypothetical protein
VVSVGTHEQWIVLTRGDALAKALHTKDWLRIEVFPIVLCVPWGLTIGIVPYLPMPAQTTVAFGPPLSWPELDPGDAENPVILQRCYDEVHAAMQREMDALAKDRTTFFG